MPRFDFPHPDLQVAGALAIEADDGGGIRPRRLPAWAREQSTDLALDLMAQMTCGVRLRFATSGTSFVLTLRTLRLEVQGALDPWPGPAVSVLVDGRLLADLSAPDGDVLVLDMGGEVVEFRGGHDGELRVHDLPLGRKEVEVWLPQGATCSLRSLKVSDLEGPAADPRPRWWHYGSSISHGFEASGPRSTWPSVAGDAAGANLTNLGFAGQAMLDPFVARTIAGSDAQVVSLCLGINIHNAASMTLRTFEPAVHGFLDTVREGLSGVPVLVISPVPFPAGEDVPGPDVSLDGVVRATGHPSAVALGALTIANIRDTLGRIVQSRSRTDPHLRYVDGRELLRPDEVAHLRDGLHPDAEGLVLMGRRFADTLGPVVAAVRS